MKKLVLFAAVLVALSFASCEPKAKPVVTDEAATEVVADDAVAEDGVAAEEVAAEEAPAE